MTLFSLVFSLVLILDPLGNVPLFASILSSFETKDQIKILLRELFISLAILIGFLFFGRLLISWIDISIPSIKVAGGIILFMIALGMIFPSIDTTGVSPNNQGDPFIVPLSVPLIAGPSILAAIMAYSPQVNNTPKMLLGIVIAWAISFFILMLTPVFKKIFKEKALIACTRLMGLLLTFIATEMFLKGIKTFYH